MTIKIGCDKLHLTFPMSVDVFQVVSEMFPSISKEHFISKRNRPNSWFRTLHLLKNSEDTVQVAVHLEPTMGFGRRQLLQIHGLTFSDSALNALRPTDLGRILDVAGTHAASISAIDLFVDDFSGRIPLDEIMMQALPAHYRQYFRGPLVKDSKNGPAVPRLFPSTVYFGRTGKSSCQICIYDKRLSPHQRIAEENNLLKYPWTRLELRLRGTIAKTEGISLFGEFSEGHQSLGNRLADLFCRLWEPIEPTRTRPRSCPTQTWFADLMSDIRSL